MSTLNADERKRNMFPTVTAKGRVAACFFCFVSFPIVDCCLQRLPGSGQGNLFPHNERVHRLPTPKIAHKLTKKCSEKIGHIFPKSSLLPPFGRVG